MSVTPLGQMRLPESYPYNHRVRGLVWCKAKVQSRDRLTGQLTLDPWETDWKWCIGVWTAPRGQQIGRRSYTPEPDMTDVRQWIVPGIHLEAHVECLDMQITHFAELPDDPTDGT